MDTDLILQRWENSIQGHLRRVSVVLISIEIGVLSVGAPEMDLSKNRGGSYATSITVFSAVYGVG